MLWNGQEVTMTSGTTRLNTSTLTRYRVCILQLDCCGGCSCCCAPFIHELHPLNLIAVQLALFSVCEQRVPRRYPATFPDDVDARSGAHRLQVLVHG